jgi:hypothetical protein
MKVLSRPCQGFLGFFLIPRPKARLNQFVRFQNWGRETGVVEKAYMRGPRELEALPSRTGKTGRSGPGLLQWGL